jgi:protein-S-isoprenylcysteine O-methyltransferase Ste14
MSDDPRRCPFPPAIPIGALLISWGLGKLWPIAISWPAWSRWAGAVLFVAPFTLAIWANVAFRRHNTVSNPLGKVTTLVSTGPFRFFRHPMYLNLLLSYTGGTLAFHLPWAAVLWLPVFLYLHYGVIIPEERHLEAAFGDEYAAYKSRVRRWI